MIYQSYKTYLDKRDQENLLRQIPDGKNPHKLNFSSNDYLNLSWHPQVIKRAQSYCEQWGAGANSVRLLLRSRQEIYHNLEKKIANGKNTESALLFPSAYQINATVIPALANPRIFKQKPLIFADKLVHESILHGISLSKADCTRYSHLDMGHLESLLKQYASSPQPKFIISETIFSMDGDCVDMEAITYLSRKYNAFLYLDESHAVGVSGSNGYGLSQDFAQNVDISISTLGKAVGSFGGFIACNRLLKDYLVNSCAGFIYSSVLPPAVIGAIDAAWDLIPQLETERKRMLEYAQLLRDQINKLGYSTGKSITQIIPIILEDNQKAVVFSAAFNQAGIALSAIRPPTVPEKSARLRVCINATHTRENLDYFMEVLHKAKEKKWK